MVQLHRNTEHQKRPTPCSMEHPCHRLDYSSMREVHQCSLQHRSCQQWQRRWLSLLPCQLLLQPLLLPPLLQRRYLIPRCWWQRWLQLRLSLLPYQSLLRPLPILLQLQRHCSILHCR